MSSQPRSVPTVGAATAGLAAVAVLGGMAWAIGHTSYDVWGGLLIGPLLALFTLPLIFHTTARLDGPRAARLMLYGFGAKLVGAFLRYAVAFELYSGAADANQYHGRGRAVADALRHGDFSFAQANQAGGTGTKFLRGVTGVVYTFTGPSKLGGFMVFTWLSFLGLYCFYRAFRTALPEGDFLRYGRLLFFLPSMVFWSSSIGKEAWMTFTLGLAALGTARVLRSRKGGFVLTAVGLGAAAAVRPHIAVIAFGGLVVAYAFRRGRTGAPTAAVFKGVGLVILVVVGALLLRQASGFFNVEELDATTVESVLDSTAERTSVGDSHFSAQPVKSPLDIPRAGLSVLFRPFPWEAGNVQSLVAAMEGLFLLALTALSARRWIHIGKVRRLRSYVDFAAVYVLLFVVAFSSIGNFGILVRQRVQVLPFGLVVLALPFARRGASGTLDALADADTDPDELDDDERAVPLGLR